MNLQALTVGAFGITIFLAVLTEGMIVTRAVVALVTLSMTPIGARLQLHRYASLQEARI